MAVLTSRIQQRPHTSSTKRTTKHLGVVLLTATILLLLIAFLQYNIDIVVVVGAEAADKTVGNDEFKTYSSLFLIFDVPQKRSWAIGKCDGASSPTKKYYLAAFRTLATMNSVSSILDSGKSYFTAGINDGSNRMRWDSTRGGRFENDAFWDFGTNMWTGGYLLQWKSQSAPYYNAFATSSGGMINSGTADSEEARALCVAYRCNVDDGDDVRFNLQSNSLTCSGHGTMIGYYPTCSCKCDQYHHGPTCLATNTITISLIVTTTISVPMTTTTSQLVTTSLMVTNSLPITTTTTLPITQSADITQSQSLTQSALISLSDTISHTESVLKSESMSLPRTPSMTMSLPPTNTRTVSNSLSPAVTLSSTLSRSGSYMSVTESISAASTLSGEPTATDIFTKSLSHTLTKEETSTTTPDGTDSISHATSTITSTATGSNTCSLSTTTSLLSTSTESISNTLSITASDTPSISSQPTATISLPQTTTPSSSQATISTSISKSEVVSATKSGMTITASLSASDSSRCGVLPYMIGKSLMCIMDAAETPEEELLYRACPTSISAATGNESHTFEGVWRLGTTQPAALVLPSQLWFIGQHIPKCLQVDQPLSLPSLSVITDGWVNVTLDSDFPMLVDVTKWMDSSARTGPFKVTISTTVRFYRVDTSVPFGNITVDPNDADSATISAKRTILRMMMAFPDQRVGMYIHYAGSIDQKLANADPTVFGYGIPIIGLGCESQLRLAQASASSSSTSPTVNSTTSSSFTGLASRLQLNPPSSLLVDVTATANDILDVLKKVGTVMSIVGMIPSVILALGIQNSIQSMSQCEGWWIPITLADGSTYSVIDVQSMIAGELDFLTSPFAIGAKAIGDVQSAWVGVDPQEEATTEARVEAELAIPQLGQYLRGAILTTISMMTIFSVGVFILVVIAWRARRLAGTDTLSTTEFPPNTSWWQRERQDIFDAAALIQVPSISIIGMSLLTDGVSQAGTTLLGMRISFMGDDGYSVVYRSLALEKGILPDLIFTTGTVEATGVAPVFWDMLLAIVGLVLMSVYCLHILYTTTYYPPITLLPIDEGAHTNHHPTTKEGTHNPHTTTPGGLEVEMGHVGGGDDTQLPPPEIRVTGSHSNSSDDLGLVLEEEEEDDSTHPFKTSSPSSSSIVRTLKYLFEPELHFAAELPPHESIKAAKGVEDALVVDHNGDPVNPNDNQNDIEMEQEQQDVVHHETANPVHNDDGTPTTTTTSPPPHKKEQSLQEKRYTDGVRWISLYGLYVNGTIWAPYLCLEFSIAYVVTIMEGAASGTISICSGKCIFALLLVAIQFAALLIKGPLGARFDQVTTVLAVGLTLVSGTLMTVGLMTNNSVPEVTIAASFVMITASLVVTVQGVVGMVAMLISITATLKQILAYIRIRQARAAAARRKLAMEANGIDADFEADFYGGGAAGELILPIVENNSGSSNGSIFDSIVGVLRASFGHGEAPPAYTPPATPQVPEGYENWKDFLDELEIEEQNLPSHLRRPPAAAARRTASRGRQAATTDGAVVTPKGKLDEEELDDLNLLLNDDDLEVEEDFRAEKMKKKK